MIVKHVTFYIKTEYINKFIEATLENQKNSRLEEGIKCFDFFQSTDDLTKFLLYEGYECEEAMEEHLKTEHFKKWINTVEDWFLIPRERSIYIPIQE
jgi:autoinducer 2-degrading protein